MCVDDCQSTHTQQQDYCPTMILWIEMSISRDIISSIYIRYKMSMWNAIPMPNGFDTSNPNAVSLWMYLVYQ